MQFTHSEIIVDDFMAFLPNKKLNREWIIPLSVQLCLNY